MNPPPMPIRAVYSAFVCPKLHGTANGQIMQHWHAKRMLSAFPVASPAATFIPLYFVNSYVLKPPLTCTNATHQLQYMCLKTAETIYR
jgi:hypothetical protein